MKNNNKIIRKIIHNRGYSHQIVLPKKWIIRNYIGEVDEYVEITDKGDRLIIKYLPNPDV